MYQYCKLRLNSLLLYNNIFDFVKIFKTKMSIEGHLYRNMCHRNTKSLKYVNHDHSLQLKPLGNVGFRVKKLRQERIYSANAVRVAFWISLANAIRVNRLFTPDQEKKLHSKTLKWYHSSINASTVQKYVTRFLLISGDRENIVNLQLIKKYIYF